MIGAVPNGATLQSERPDAVRPGGYMQLSGTSFAAPVVSGAAAEILAKHPNLTPDQVKGALMLTAKPLDRSVGLAGGVGEVSVNKALDQNNPPNPNLALTAFVGNAQGQTGVVFNAASWNRAAQSNASWNSASWNSASWNSASWNSASWNSASWNSASWNSASWNSASWNSASWNSASWNRASWNSASWHNVSLEDMLDRDEQLTAGEETGTVVRVRDRQQRRRRAPRRSLRESRLGLLAGAYFWLVVAAAVATTFPFLSQLSPDTQGWMTFVVLRSSRRGRPALPGRHAAETSPTTRRSCSSSPAALLLPPELVALLAVVQHVPEWLKERYPWYIQTFNICELHAVGDRARGRRRTR